MLIKILTYFFCFLGLSLNIQATSLIFNYKVRNYTIVNIFLVLICTAPSMIFIDKSISSTLPPAFKLMLIAVYYLGRLCSYFIIYRKINLKILYVFLLTINLPQIYLNLFKPILSNYMLANLIAFISDVAITAFILIYITKKDYARFINGLVESLPARIYVLTLILMYIASIFVMGETKENHEVYVKFFLLPSMIGLVAATISIIRISISESEKKATVELLSKQFENQIEYYEKIQKIYDEFRSFRHDFKNHILCLRSLVSAGQIDEAIEYMNDMESMATRKKEEFNTGNIIIDALLNDKSEKAQKANAKLEFSGFVPTVGITKPDLCIIMANATDNAIEACAKDESSEIKIIKIDANFKQSYFFLKISNPMFEEVKLNGKKLMTSKEDKERHGFGVANIKRTVEKYEGTMDITTENNTFVLEIQMHLCSSELTTEQLNKQ